MQVAQVEDKVELIMLGGYMAIYLHIINILQIKDMADSVLLIIVQFLCLIMTRMKMRIILVIAPIKEMDYMEWLYIIQKK